MVENLVKDLLESGVHFGHQTKRWNPKMKKFIFGQRSGIYIIDLEKTAEYLTMAGNFMYDVAAKGGTILLVGTKKQAQMIVEEEAKKAGMFYVANRWLGGLLTNFQTVKQSIARLSEIERMDADGVWANLKKKEIATIMKEKEKLLRDLGGIREMTKVPDAIFIVDPKREAIAVKEAHRLNIPIIAIVDTNCNPEEVNYPIPGNDDALKSIKFITGYVAQCVNKGRKEFDPASVKDEILKQMKENSSEASVQEEVLVSNESGASDSGEKTETA